MGRELPVVKIVSGGQTGADRAALDVALALGLPLGGWCPAGRQAEDGPLPEHYPLTETASPIHAVRTRANVRDADGTLIFNLGNLDGGTLLTVDCAKKLRKPHLLVQLDAPEHPDLAAVAVWLRDNRIHVLNVAGPRESKRPGIYAATRGFLVELLAGVRGDAGGDESGGGVCEK